jgi:hypothetical protein
MEQTHKTHKVRDLAIGFFGWFVIGNLGGYLWFATLSSLYLHGRWVDYFAASGIPLVTITVIGILLKKKRNWFAYGIMTAVITNALIIVNLLGLAHSLDFFSTGITLLELTVPLPLAFAFLFEEL